MNDNGGTIAVVTAILAVGLWVTTNMTNLQIKQAEEFQEQRKQFSEALQGQQKQFAEMIEKIGKIDGDARVRDKDLEIAITKIES